MLLLEYKSKYFKISFKIMEGGGGIFLLFFFYKISSCVSSNLNLLYSHCKFETYVLIFTIKQGQSHTLQAKERYTT